jgi:OFA family oxalate/formate antiporter-like MFS transporter
MRTNRWAIAVAGTVAMICLGTVYSWSLFTQPLIAAFRWSNTTTTWTFALAIFFLGVGAIVGGRWQDKRGPRPVAVTGVVLWGVANVLAGLGATRLGAPWMYLTYGVLGGLGLGLGYVTPVATVTKWFPDKRGLGSGMVVMGFGLGAFLYNNVLKAIPAFSATAAEAGKVIAARGAGTAGATLSADGVGTLMSTFVWSGIVFAVLGGICASFLRNPSPEDLAPFTRAAARAAAGAAPAAGRTATAALTDYPPSQALRTPQFWALWAMLFLNVTAGILFISNAVPIMRELTGAPPATALAVYGFIALFNGLGRFFWGAVSDRIGRNMAYVLIYGTQVVIFFVVGGVHSLWLVAALFAIVLLDYGGGFGTMPSFTADYFGTKYMGVNYGWILSAWGVGGIVGPIFVAAVKDRTGSFSGALPVIAIMLLAAMILPIVTHKPGEKRERPFYRGLLRRARVGA